jgi:toxin ParE1/3/4
MARYRLTRSARRDIDSILRTSEERHGREARIRYAVLLLAAMRRVAEDPQGRSTLDRSELRPGIRSFHIRHSRGESREGPVANPVHVIFYRAVRPGLVEIVRVLHDRMEPKRHVGAQVATQNRPDESE